MPRGKFVLGAREVKEESESVPIELLPSNKSLYLAKLNNEDNPDLEPVRCKHMKEVFENFKPSFEVELETTEGETVNAEFKIESMKDFSSKELTQKNDNLKKTYYQQEILRDLNKQLSKNKTLLKTLKDPKKREGFLKLIDSYIALLGSKE
jgi:predicted component of type VI protein secretion system